MGWNPEKKPYCKGCPNYEAMGRYVYELERDPKMRECRHAGRCKRVHDVSTAAMQTSFFDHKREG